MPLKLIIFDLASITVRSNASVRPKPFAERTIRTLQKMGAKVAVTTDFSAETASTILDRLEWHDLVDAWVSSDQVEHGRPHPDMINLLMKKFGIADPANVAKVGNTPADLREGTNAGCGWVIGVIGSAHAKAKLGALPHTHLVDDLWQVAQITVDEFAYA